MIRALARPFIALLLAFMLVLPQASVAIAKAGLTDQRVVVICTGDGVRLVILDGDGAPVDLTQDAERCGLVQVADTSAKPVHGAVRIVKYLPVDLHILAATRPESLLGYSPAQPRGPPVS